MRCEEMDMSLRLPRKQARPLAKIAVGHSSQSLWKFQIFQGQGVRLLCLSLCLFSRCCLSSLRGREEKKKGKKKEEEKKENERSKKRALSPSPVVTFISDANRPVFGLFFLFSFLSAFRRARAALRSPEICGPDAEMSGRTGRAARALRAHLGSPLFVLLFFSPFFFPSFFLFPLRER